jgi:hypothetical protein
MHQTVSNKTDTTEEKLEAMEKAMETMQREVKDCDNNPENPIMKELKKMNSGINEINIKNDIRFNRIDQMNIKTNIRIDDLAKFFR